MAKIRVTVELELREEEMKNCKVTPKQVLKGIVAQESDVIDGCEITTDIKGFDNAWDFFLINATIVDKKLIEG